VKTKLQRLPERTAEPGGVRLPEIIARRIATPGPPPRRWWWIIKTIRACWQVNPMNMPWLAVGC